MSFEPLRSVRAALVALAVPLAGVAMMAAPASAQEEAEAPPQIPPYLMGELGVRVVLPEKVWEVPNDDWTDYGLKGTSKDGVILFVWTTAYQVDINDDTLAAWEPVYLKEARTEGKASARSIVDFRGTKAAYYELELTNAEGGQLAMYAYSVPFEGVVAHFATATVAAKAGLAKSELDGIMERLEVRAAAPALTWGGVASTTGIEANLDPYWRLPIGKERTLVVEEAARMGIASLKGCWTAIHPHPAGKTDIMIACQDTRNKFPIIDALTFSDHETTLREKWFAADAAPAEVATLAGRMSFWWQAKVGERVLNTAAIPNEAGFAKVVAVAASGQDDRVAAAARATLEGANISPHPEPLFEDLLRYYVVYQPTSPLVIGPAVVLVLVFLGILGLILFGLRKQAQLARAEMEALDAE
jgi:hypothetical protein